MTVRVKLFAVARQLADAQEVVVELPHGATVGDLRRELASRVPSLADLLPHVAFAVNAVYATDAETIPEGAEVACIPPVSGG